MDAKLIRFGEIEVDGQRYDHDIVLEGGQVRRRKKGPSKPYRGKYGHTPLSADEEIPWSAPLLIIGTGADGRLPITPEVYEVARTRGVEVVAVPTAEACASLQGSEAREFAAILHVTC